MEIAHKKIRDAVNSLILSNPLFAAILIQQKFVEDNSAENPTFAVNGETFAFNSGFADSLTFDECKAVCAHEASHLALLHHVRMNKRDLETWNQATDFAINSELQKQGFKLPKGALLDPNYADKSAEDIYADLQKKKQKDSPQSQNQKPGQGKQSGQNQSQGQGNPNQSGNPSPSSNGSPNQNPCNPSQTPSCGQVKPSPTSAGNPAQAEAKAKAQVEKAMSIARMAGQLPGGIERAIKQAETPRFDWNEILHRFFQELTANDYSFTSPNKRFIQAGFILPSLRSRDLGRIILAIDASGSVSLEQMSAMVSRVQDCIETYCENGLAEGLTVIYCDSQIQGVEILFSGDSASPKGGGGTRFIPVFDYLKNDLGNAACLVYLTDGDCSESMSELERVTPSYPVLWGLIRDNPSFNPPFGEVFKMDIHA